MQHSVKLGGRFEKWVKGGNAAVPNKISEKFFRKMYSLAMRYFLLPLLAALLLSACDPYRNQEAAQKIKAALAEPCVAAVKTTAAKEGGAEYRGFRLYDVMVTEMAPGNHAVRVRYQDITLVHPVGGSVKRLDCELRDGVVVTLRHP